MPQVPPDAQLTMMSCTPGGLRRGVEDTAGRHLFAAAFTHIGDVPAGTANVHGHVHNNEPVRLGHHVNICVRHTDYRPLPLQASASVGTTDSPPCSTAVSGASVLTGVRFDQSPSIAAVSTPSNRRASLQWPGTSEPNGSRWPID